MLAYSVASKSAIEGHAYTEDARVQITLPAGLYSDVTLACKSITIQGATTTDAPPGSRLQPGYSARQATIVLSGQVDARDTSKTAAWLFGQYSKTSPLYRLRRLYTPVTIDRGVYITGQVTPEWFRRFTGRIDGASVDARTGDVTLRCVDNRSRLRSELTIPAVVTQSPFNAGLTSEYAIDAILRAATAGAISSWPDTRPLALLAVGLRSSLWPEVGVLNTTASQPTPFFGPGAWATGLVGAAIGAGGWSYPIWTLTSPAATDINLECLIGDISAGPVTIYIGTSDRLECFYAVIDPTGINVVQQTSLGTGDNYLVSHAIDDGPHLVDVKISMAPGSTSWSVTVRIDAFTSASGPRTSGRARSALPFDSVTIVPAGVTGGAVAGLQVTSETTAATSYPFAPGAVLDESLNPLVVVPAVTGDPWQAIQEIASAEQGVCGFDESGVFQFKNRVTLTTGISVRDVTSKQALLDLTAEESASALINHAKADYTTWKFAARAWVWQATSPIKVPPGVTVVNAAPTSGDLWTDVDTTAVALPGPGGTPGNTNYLVAGSQSGAAEFSGTLVFNVQQVASDQVRVTITNPTAQTAWLVCPASYTGPIAVGTPLLYIGAVPVTQSNTITVDAQWPLTTDPDVGDVLFNYPSNLWRQDQDAAQSLVDSAVIGGNVVRANFGEIPVFPDPRLQLTDRVHVIDDDASGIDEYVQLWGITEQMAYSDWSMNISGTAIARPGGWILGVVGRSELGMTTGI